MKFSRAIPKISLQWKVATNARAQTLWHCSPGQNNSALLTQPSPNVTVNPEYFACLLFHVFRVCQIPYKNIMRTNAIQKIALKVSGCTKIMRTERRRSPAYGILVRAKYSRFAESASLLFKFSRCRKLPKGLWGWQAYKDLKKKIDDFNECCPLLELMSDKAMKERHWRKLEEITGHKFEVESEGFSLRDVMAAPLLENREDIEVRDEGNTETVNPEYFLCFSFLYISYAGGFRTKTSCLWMQCDRFICIKDQRLCESFMRTKGWRSPTYEHLVRTKYFGFAVGSRKIRWMERSRETQCFWDFKWWSFLSFNLFPLFPFSIMQKKRILKTVLEK